MCLVFVEFSFKGGNMMEMYNLFKFVNFVEIWVEFLKKCKLFDDVVNEFFKEGKVVEVVKIMREKGFFLVVVDYVKRFGYYWFVVDCILVFVFSIVDLLREE